MIFLGQFNTGNFGPVGGTAVLPPPPPPANLLTIWKVDYLTLTAPILAAKFFDNSEKPVDPNDLTINLQGAPDLFKSIDFGVITNGVDIRRVDWSAYPASLLNSAAPLEKVKIKYPGKVTLLEDNTVVEQVTLTGPMIAAKQLPLSVAPEQLSDVEATIQGNVDSDYSIDFIGASPNIVDWTGLGWDGFVITGMVIQFKYKLGAVGTYIKYSHTVTAGEAAAKNFDLRLVPINPQYVEATIPGATDGFYLDDFNIISDGLELRRFNWAGLGFDAFISTGTEVMLQFTGI